MCRITPITFLSVEKVEWTDEDSKTFDEFKKDYYQRIKDQMPEIQECIWKEMREYPIYVKFEKRRNHSIAIRKHCQDLWELC